MALIERSKEEPPYTILGSTFGIAFGMLFFTWIGLIIGAVLGVSAGFLIERKLNKGEKRAAFAIFLASALIIVGSLNIYKWIMRDRESVLFVVYFISAAVFWTLSFLLLRKGFKSTKTKR